MDKVESISLGNIFKIIIQNKKSISVFVIVTMILGGIYSFLLTEPTYSVTYKIRINQTGPASNYGIKTLLTKEGQGNINQTSSTTDVENLKVDKLISVFKNDPEYYPHLLSEIKKSSSNFDDLTVNELKHMIDFSLVSDVDMVNIKATAPIDTEAATLGKITAKNFKEFIETKNFEALATNINMTKSNLDFNISLYKNKISRLEKEVSKLGKTVPNTNEINPTFKVYLEDIAKNRIALSDTEAEYEEITRFENQLIKQIKENGLVTTVEPPENGQVISSSANHFFNVIMSALIGLILGVFYLVIRKTRQKV